MDDFVAAADELANQGRTAEAEAMYRKVLEADPSHEGAAVAVAGILLAGGDAESALAVLEPLPSSAAVDRVRAAARLGTGAGAPVQELEDGLSADPDNDRLRIDLAKKLAAAGAYERSLGLLLEVIIRKGDLADDARSAMLDVFELLGPENPLTPEYRRRLANALF